MNIFQKSIWQADWPVAIFYHHFLNLMWKCMWLLEQQIEEYERVEQEKMKERHIANKKFLERMRQDESMQQFDG